jgi:hypothetical protein
MAQLSEGTDSENALQSHCHCLKKVTIAFFFPTANVVTMVLKRVVLVFLN